MKKENESSSFSHSGSKGRAAFERVEKFLNDEKSKEKNFQGLLFEYINDKNDKSTFRDFYINKTDTRSADELRDSYRDVPGNKGANLWRDIKACALGISENKKCESKKEASDNKSSKKESGGTDKIVSPLPKKNKLILNSRIQRNRTNEPLTYIHFKGELQSPKETIGFAIEIPLPYKPNHEYRVGADRSPLVLTRKYIKAVNTLRKNFHYVRGEGITPEDLGFANQYMQLVFVLNSKTTKEASKQDYVKILRHAEYYNDLFSKLGYPAYVEVNLWESEKDRFRPRMVRALSLYVDGEPRKRIEKLASKHTKTFLLIADADLVSLHPENNKSVSIFNSIKKRYEKEHGSSIYPPRIIRLLGGYRFNLDEIWKNIRAPEQKKPDVEQTKKILLTYLFNQVDMAARSILSLVHPNLPYYAEPNSAYDWQFFNSTMVSDAMLTEATRDRGSDYCWIINKLIAKQIHDGNLEGLQHFSLGRKSRLATSSRHDLVDLRHFPKKRSIKSGTKAHGLRDAIVKATSTGNLHNFQLRTGQLNERFKEAWGRDSIFIAIVQVIVRATNVSAPIKNILIDYFHVGNKRFVEASESFPTFYPKTKTADQVLKEIEGLGKSYLNMWSQKKDGKRTADIPTDKSIRPAVNFLTQKTSLNKFKSAIKIQKKGKKSGGEKEVKLPQRLTDDELTLKRLIIIVYSFAYLLAQVEELCEKIILLEAPLSRTFKIFAQSDNVNFKIRKAFDEMARGYTDLLSGSVKYESEIRDEKRESDVLDSKLDDAISDKYTNIEGLDFYEVDGDGHCLYRAVAESLNELNVTVETFQNLRDNVATFLETELSKENPENKDRIRLLNSYIASREETIVEYISGIRGSVHGGNIEIETLMEIYQVPIIVIDKDGYIRNASDNPGRFTGEPIFIHFVDNHNDAINHYNRCKVTNPGTGREILDRLLVNTLSHQSKTEKPLSSIESSSDSVSGAKSIMPK